MKINKCEAGHTSHKSNLVDTALGEMFVWDYKQYMDFKGYCTGQDALSETLTLSNHWEHRLFEKTWQILENGDRNNLVIDIGAHIGWYSRMAFSFGYEVHAFEGDLENIELLKLNVPVIKATQIWFDEFLDGAFDTDKTIEFMKLDIEGAEQHAIRYMRKVLMKTKNILIEVSPAFNDSYPELLKSLKNMGFEIFFEDGKPFDYKYNFSQKDLWLRRKV